MTLDQIQALTDDEIRVRVGTILGWDCDPVEAHDWPSRGQWVVRPGAAKRQLTSRRMDLPNYPADLNACHDAFKSMGIVAQIEWHSRLHSIVRATCADNIDDESVRMVAVNASARQRCEAFLAVMGGKPL